jgi:NAD-dependent SIR2 family protein deacetylase
MAGGDNGRPLADRGKEMVIASLQNWKSIGEAADDDESALIIIKGNIHHARCHHDHIAFAAHLRRSQEDRPRLSPKISCGAVQSGGAVRLSGMS